MRCPTCGKPAKKQNVCSYCGAVVTELRATETPALSEAKPAPEPLLGDWEMHPRPPAMERPVTAPEAAPQAEEAASWPEEPEAETPAPRRPVPLSRVLLLLLFLLVPLLNVLLRNFGFDRIGSEVPVLREAVLGEQRAGGAPVSPKSDFSLRQDRQAVLYTEWRGSRQSHAIIMHWHPPQGRRLETPVRYETGRRAFAATGVLPLRAGMPPGTWKAEVLLDGQLRASLNFQIRE